LTALVQSPGHVCCRYRLTAFRPFLEQAGHSLDVRPYPETPWEWLRLVRDLRGADAVILQRKLPQRWKLALLRRAVNLLLFDFDDAVFARDSYAAKGVRSAARCRRFASVVRAADGIVAGNSFLRDQATRFAGRDRIRIIPTCVDTALYSPAAHVRTEHGIELVWVGSSSTLQGLERAASLLERLGQRWPGLRLNLVCDRPLTFRHLPVRYFPWSETTEREVLAASDIGLSWVPNDQWSQGKCGLKVLQYLAAGLPVVANPVGVQADLIRPGKNGFLAESAEQWLEVVGQLVCNPRLRQDMGCWGRQWVETHYGVAVGAAGWLNLLGQLGRRRKTG
jgi:glycosyltransferase involved in cell wall biosynthesis